MKRKVIVRKRKSVKNGATYEYRFETASIGGQRKWISKVRRVFMYYIGVSQRESFSDKLTDCFFAC